MHPLTKAIHDHQRAAAEYGQARRNTVAARKAMLVATAHLRDIAAADSSSATLRQAASDFDRAVDALDTARQVQRTARKAEKAALAVLHRLAGEQDAA